MSGSRDVLERVASLGRSLHGSDQSMRIEERGVHDRTRLPVNAVLDGERLGLHQREPRIRGDEIEIEPHDRGFHECASLIVPGEISSARALSGMRQGYRMTDHPTLNQLRPVRDE